MYSVIAASSIILLVVFATAILVVFICCLRKHQRQRVEAIDKASEEMLEQQYPLSGCQQMGEGSAKDIADVISMSWSVRSFTSLFHELNPQTRISNRMNKVRDTKCKSKQ